MGSFFYRVMSMGLRFGCPLLILALSTPATMGQYYLFVTYFTFIVFLVAFELAIPFSRKYLRKDDARWRRKVFSTFIVSQFVLSMFLAVPATMIYFFSLSAPLVLIMLFALAVISETCVNEIGRFYWNIGASHIASLRDFIRSIIFVVAVLASVMLEHEVVSAISLGIIIVCNGTILWREICKWGDRGAVVRTLFAVRHGHFRLMLGRVRYAIAESLPQVVHVQVMALQPLLERTLIEMRLGLELVASYSFQYSIVQSGASLFLLPVVAHVRRTIFSSADVSVSPVVRRLAMELLVKILGIAVVLALAAHYAVPLLAAVFNKGIASSIVVLAAALLSSAVAMFCSAISPLYAQRSRLWVANLTAAAGLLPLAVFMLPAPEGMEGSEAYVMGVIIFAAIAQLAARVVHLVKRPS